MFTYLLQFIVTAPGYSALCSGLRFTVSSYGPRGLHNLDSGDQCRRAQELCESRGGCPGLPVPNSPQNLIWSLWT